MPPSSLRSTLSIRTYLYSLSLFLGPLGSKIALIFPQLLLLLLLLPRSARYSRLLNQSQQQQQQQLEEDKGDREQKGTCSAMLYIPICCARPVHYNTYYTDSRVYVCISFFTTDRVYLYVEYIGLQYNFTSASFRSLV